MGRTSGSVYLNGDLGNSVLISLGVRLVYFLTANQLHSPLMQLYEATASNWLLQE